MAEALETQAGDLIDLHVGSPILPRMPSSQLLESPTESLLDSEFIILEEKLQATPLHTVSLPKNYVEIDDILITIDDDDIVKEDIVITKNTLNTSIIENCLENLHAINLDNNFIGDPTDSKKYLSLIDSSESAPGLSTCSKIEGLLKNISPSISVPLSPSILSINGSFNDSTSNSVNGSFENLEALDVLMKLDEILNETLEKSNNILENLEEDKQSVEDCLEDLDNYLKTLDVTTSSDDHAEVLNESVVQIDLELEGDACSENLNYDYGLVNPAFENTELNFIRCPLRSTVACVGSESAIKRGSFERRSEGEFPHALGRISGNGLVTKPWQYSPPNDNNQHQRTHAPGDCYTGSVIVEPPQQESQTSNEDRHGSSWLRSSMRRIQHLRIPSNDVCTGTESSTSSAMVVAQEVSPIGPQLVESSMRPLSAPSCLTTHIHAATQSSVRRNITVGEIEVPRAGARSRSSASRSRRPRSLSSSESSLASTVDTTPSCTPAPTPTRNHQDSISENIRRSCERVRRQTDMPEAESPLGHWPHSLSSMLACLGCTMGLFNISRFAILTVHFGANFIFQFFLLSVVIGLPLFTLQLCLGQQLGAGVIDMWRISPLFQGVGVALLASQAFIGLYSIVGVAWMFVYFRDSFITKIDKYRWAEPFSYYRYDAKSSENGTTKLSETVPDYFSGIVLQRYNIASGNHSGIIKFQLAFNLAVIWMIVFVSLSKGLRSYGKVIYVFTLVPVFGMFVVCAKILSLIPPDFVYIVFPETSWSEFFLNARSWLAASQEVFLTWGLLGAAVMQIASHNKHKHLLQRDSSLIALITFAILLLSAFLANTCVQILKSHGFNYLPSSFEKINSYSFLRLSNDALPPNLATVPVRAMLHQSFIVGERVSRPGVDYTSESGYQALRLATELVPATFAVMGSEEISPFWAVLFYFILILFGIAQQLAIWHCVITGIMAIKANILKSWETTITFFSCACGFLLGLPFATEYGIYIIYFMDFTIGGMWWLVLIVLLEIIAVFMVRGRPYSGDALVNVLFMSPTTPCILSWAPALLSFTWNVILPVGLMVCCVAFFKNGNFRELFVWHHAPSLEYWPMWARQIGSMFQLIPVLCVPMVAVIQSYRYLNNGPADILERIQLLYRPPIGEHMQDIPAQEVNPSGLTTSNINNNNGSLTPIVTTEDPPPKYTPPPSYTTATGARIAKFLRQSLRRSVRRIVNVLGEGSSRQRHSSPSQTQLPPPDYSVVLDEMSTRTDGGVQTNANQSTLGREIALARNGSTALTIAEVASILRNSFRRSRIRAANTLRRNRTITTEPNPHASLSAENLVDSAAPIGETSLVLNSLTDNQEIKPANNNLSSVI